MTLIVEANEHKFPTEMAERLRVDDQGNLGIAKEIRPNTWECASTLSHLLQDHPDCEIAKRAIEADPLIASHLGKMVGTEMECIRLTSEDVVMKFLLEFLGDGNVGGLLDCAVCEGTRQDELEEASFTRALSRFQNAFAGKSVETEIFTILDSFQMEGGRLELEPGLVLEGLSKEAVALLWNTNSHVRQFYSLWEFPRKAIEEVSGVLWLRVQTPKIVYDEKLPPQDTKYTIKDAIDSLLLVTNALHLVKAGAVTIGPIFAGAAFPFLHESTYTLPRYGFSAFGGQRYKLEATDHQLLIAIVGALRKALQGTRNNLLTGVKRIGYASERVSSEDALLDTMIALEALVLSGKGDSKYRGELRFRLSLYVARLLAEHENERKRLFELVRGAYDLRSKVVHGDTLDRHEEARVGEISEIARKVALELLRRTAANESPPDWDSLTLK